MEYSGSDWIERSLKISNMSQLGKDVADMLGELFYGIYHMDTGALRKVDWSNPHHIIVPIGWKTWSTTDDNNLTRLVFLAHHRAIRVGLSSHTFNHIKLVFHQRQRGLDGMRCHPTLEAAVHRFRNSVSLPEYTEELSE